MSVNTTITADLTAKREALRTALTHLGYSVANATWEEMAEIVRQLFFIDAAASNFEGTIYPDDNSTPAALRGLTVRDVIEQLFANTNDVLSNDTNKHLTASKFRDNNTILYVPSGVNGYDVQQNTTDLSTCFAGCTSLMYTPFHVSLKSNVNGETTENVQRTDHNNSTILIDGVPYAGRTCARPLKYKNSSYKAPEADTSHVSNMQGLFQNTPQIAGTIRLDVSSCKNCKTVFSQSKLETLILDNAHSSNETSQIVSQCKRLTTILGLCVDNRLNSRHNPVRNRLVYYSMNNLIHIDMVASSVVCFNARRQNMTYELSAQLNFRNNACNNLDADSIMQLVESMYDWINDPDYQGGAVGYTQSSKTLFQKLAYYELVCFNRTYNGSVAGIDYTGQNPIDSRSTAANNSNYIGWTDSLLSANNYEVCRFGLTLCFSTANLQTLSDAGLLETADKLAQAKGWRLCENNTTIDGYAVQGAAYQNGAGRPNSDFTN